MKIYFRRYAQNHQAAFVVWHCWTHQPFKDAMNDPPSRSSQICQPSTWLVPCHTVGVQQWGYLEGLCKGYENWKLTCFFSENLSSFLPAPKNLSHFCGVVYFTRYILKGRFQWVFHEVWPQNRCKEDMRENYTLKIILVPGRGDSHGIPSFYGFHVSWTKKKITNLNCLRESLVIQKKLDSSTNIGGT